MPLVPSYSFGDVVRFSGVTKSNLTHWLHKGVIDAHVADTTGTGHHRAFSFANIVEAAIAGELTRYGLGVAAISEVLDGVRRFDDRPELWRPADIEKWRRFRDPATRPEEWTAELLVTLVSDERRFVAALVVGPPTVAKPKPFVIITLTIHLANLLRRLEEQTGGDYWRPFSRLGQRRQIDQEYRLRREHKRQAEEAARIDQLAATQPAVALDRRLRAELGLPSLTYGPRWWESPLLTEEKAEEYRRGLAAAGDKGAQRGKRARSTSRADIGSR